MSLPDRNEPTGALGPRSALLRAVFVFLAALALAIGSVLILFPEGTGAYFAWAIRAPIAAATLGGWFLGLGILAASLARAARWSAARLAVPMIALGAMLLLIATLLHRPAFDWSSPPAWIWLILHLVVPPGFLALYIVNERAAPSPLPAEPPLSPPLRTVLRAAAGTYGVCGGLMFLWPSALLAYWPWPLLPLGARVYAAFILAYVAGAWLVSRAGAARAAAMPLSPFALLPLLAFAIPWLHNDAFHPTRPGGLVYLLLTGGVGVALGAALRHERRTRAQPANPT